MKCNTITECQGDKHLIINIDLRTEQTLRAAEIERQIVFLKEKAGENHISVNLTYSENNQLKQTNLPAYLKESAQHRTLCLLFPPDMQVSIWKNGVDIAINQLEYQIDRRTQTVNEISGTAQTTTDSTFNFVAIDLDLMTEEEGLNAPALQDSIYQQGLRFTDMEKPFLFKITKTIGTTRAVCYFYNRATSLIKGVSKKFHFTIPIDITNSDIAKAIGGGRIFFRADQTDDGSYEVYFENSINGIPGIEAIFLCENSDGFLTAQDRNMSSALGILATPWDRFGTAIEEKRFPAVYLKSMDSEEFCPVSYLFTPNTTNPSNFDGKMVISYFKTVGENTELWRETRKFTNTTPSTGAVFEFELKKFALTSTN